MAVKIIIVMLLLIQGCSSKTQHENKQSSQESHDSSERKKIDSTLYIHPMTNKSPWHQSYDFDGDEKIDTIFYTYSGGAHCCYTLRLKLSSNQQTTKIPYLIEGGYILFDLSNPDNFNIFDIDQDNKYEIFIKALPDDIYIDFEKKEKGDSYFNKIKYKPIPKEQKNN